jgi:hypothetical protein
VAVGTLAESGRALLRYDDRDLIRVDDVVSGQTGRRKSAVILRQTAWWAVMPMVAHNRRMHAVQVACRLAGV